MIPINFEYTYICIRLRSPLSHERHDCFIVGTPKSIPICRATVPANQADLSNLCMLPRAVTEVVVEVCPRRADG